MLRIKTQGYNNNNFTICILPSKKKCNYISVYFVRNIYFYIFISVYTECILWLIQRILCCIINPSLESLYWRINRLVTSSKSNHSICDILWISRSNTSSILSITQKCLILCHLVDISLFIRHRIIRHAYVPRFYWSCTYTPTCLLYAWYVQSCK